MRCCWTDVSDCSVCDKLLNCTVGNEILHLQLEVARLKAAAEPKTVNKVPLIGSKSARIVRETDETL